MAKKFSVVSLYGPLLAEYREKAGLTQDELANHLGITRVTLTGWEGQVAVKLDEKQSETLKKVLKVQNLDVLTNVPHGTLNNKELEVYKMLAIERMERIEELKEQVQSLRKELAEYRSRK